MNNYMKVAKDLADENLKTNEGGPFGACIVKNGEIIAEGKNERETKQNALSHAEIEAINNACAALSSWRLDDCELYVTLEPCPMCMGACLNARVDTVYFGAYEQKGRSLTEALADANLLNHKTEVVGGVLQEECAAVLSGFFISMRQKQKEEKERQKSLNANFQEKEN